MDLLSMSMDMMRLTSSCELKSSPYSQEVVLEDEDILTLILSRVPWKKLVSLKCVSKQWLSFITIPRFRKFLPPLRASGLFFHRRHALDNPGKLYFVPFDNPKTPSPFTAFTCAHRHIRILHSCNGLLLCSTSVHDLNCYVCDPSTNHLAFLPQNSRSAQGRYIGLAFDPLKSPHYKVIAWVNAYGSKNAGDFQIYSSETGTWRVSVKSFTVDPGLNFTESVYLNGCVHWLLDKKSVPKSAVSDCLYFNVDEEMLGTFPRPPIVFTSGLRRSLYFGESEGHLHVVEVIRCTTSLKVFEMESNYSGWFVKYRIDLAPISKVSPEMTQHKTCYDRNHFAVAVLSLVRRENFREDSFLILEIPGSEHAPGQLLLSS
ncbi:putative F-box domain-containing protein [Heracleum sosnowskyi]|uniref:F-box domain-containing protein n=1 Tax=Heracleum sosnowskyi TaxID=360622 RepID=A0AAD8M802_9APIA|nr:putative F-box domain-containing protein [Heracleum sosnowskyi]